VLYERLLDRTKHVKVWLSYAKFEAEPLPLPEQEQQQQPDQQQQQQPDQQQRAPGEGLSAADRAARAARARAVYERGFRSIREGSPDAKEEAVMLLEAWRDFEAAGSEFRWVWWWCVPVDTDQASGAWGCLVGACVCTGMRVHTA
jgi:crooked neck